MTCDQEGMLDFPCDVERLPNGNTLIADAGDESGGGSEIIEVDPRGQIVWQYGDGLVFAHSCKRSRDGNTLITDTTNDRVIEVDRRGRLVFSSESWGRGSGRLSDGSRLEYPNDAHRMPGGALLITDRNNNRVVLASRKGRVLWAYAQVKHPHNADPLPGGNVLIADSDDNAVIEVDRRGRRVWEYRSAADPLDWPRDADRLPNGNTLITDSKHARVIEVTPAGETVWQYKVPYFANFYDADLLANGNILIADQQHRQVLEVDRLGNVVWQFRNMRAPAMAAEERLANGDFSARGRGGLPRHWREYRKTSERGGRVVWHDDPKTGPAPGIEYDRAGAYCLYQLVGVRAGRTYRLSGQIRTEMAGLGTVAFFQLAWLDAWSGLILDVPNAPKGAVFTRSANWTQDRFDAEAPPGATAVEVRLFISGKGSAWMRNVSLERC